MADGRLALVEMLAEGTHVPFAFGQDHDDLEPGRIADVLEQDRRPPCLLEPMIGPFGPGRGGPRRHRQLGSCLRECHFEMLRPDVEYDRVNGRNSARALWGTSGSPGFPDDHRGPGIPAGEPGGALDA